MYLLSGSCVFASQSGLDTFFCSQKVLKYAVTDVIEFHSSRNVLMKIHANIFVIKSSVLNCFYHVSQLLLHDLSDLDNHFDSMNFVSVNFLS